MKPLALVIDRDAGTRKLLDVLLTRFGYEVDRIAWTAEGVTLLQLIDYDFVLAEDEEVARWMKQQRPEALSRMMIVSAATDAQLQRMWSEWDGVRIVRKPFELADVIDASRVAANRTRREPAPEELFWRQSMISGAKAGIVVRREGDTLSLVTKLGYEPGAAERYFPMSVNEQYPICAAIRHGRPVFISSLATNPDYPVLAGIWQANRTRALAAVPILRGEQVIGAAGWAFRDAQRFGEAEKRAWVSIAQNAASLVDSAASAQPATNIGA
jgi:transcriptional regulator with GAF, ATPase, and Fis domain